MLRFSRIPLVAFLAATFFVVCSSSQEQKVAYPDGYRNWAHVKSMILQPGHPLYESFGGIHHIYANEPALKALKSGSKHFPDGAVLVFDLLEAVEAENAVTEGARKVVGVMEKDKARFADTGGWGFEGFKGDTRERVVTNATAQCYTCHTSQTENDFVFSSYRP
jgi:hypothetical protein